MDTDPFKNAPLWIENPFGPDPDSTESTVVQDAPEIGDTEALDAFSKVVVGVVDSAGRAVVSVHAGHSGRRAGPEHAGAGSGAVIAPDGYILTNAHVVGGSPRIRLSFTSGDEVDGTLVGIDPPTDLAVVRAQANGLPFVSFGRSSFLRVGQLVIAMGNPFGFQSSRRGWSARWAEP